MRTRARAHTLYRNRGLRQNRCGFIGNSISSECNIYIIIYTDLTIAYLTAVAATTAASLHVRLLCVHIIVIINARRIAAAHITRSILSVRKIITNDSSTANNRRATIIIIKTDR